MPPLEGIALLAAAVGSGLVAGLCFAFASFVLRAFDRLGAPQAIRAMQSVNAAILRSSAMGVWCAGFPGAKRSRNHSRSCAKESGSAPSTSGSPGRGSIRGALIGALSVGVFTLGLRLMGADAQWTTLLIGVLIIAAVAVMLRFARP